MSGTSRQRRPQFENAGAPDRDAGGECPSGKKFDSTKSLNHESGLVRGGAAWERPRNTWNTGVRQTSMSKRPAGSRTAEFRAAHRCGQSWQHRAKTRRLDIAKIAKRRLRRRLKGWHETRLLAASFSRAQFRYKRRVGIVDTIKLRHPNPPVIRRTRIFFEMPMRRQRLRICFVAEQFVPPVLDGSGLRL